MIMTKVTGISKIQSNMATALIRQAAGWERGAKLAGLYVQRESQLIVPVDTGNLKNSAFTRNIGGKGFDADIVVGYRTDYAVYVHERLDLRHAPGKTAKYLEKIINERRQQILSIILFNMKAS